jgi:hypothetical protein
MLSNISTNAMVAVSNFALEGPASFSVFDSNSTLGDIALHKGSPIQGSLMGPAATVLLRCADVQEAVFTQPSTICILCVPYDIAGTRFLPNGASGALLLGLDTETGLNAAHLGILSLLAATIGARLSRSTTGVLRSLNKITGFNADMLCPIAEEEEEEELVEEDGDDQTNFSGSDRFSIEEEKEGRQKNNNTSSDTITEMNVEEEGEDESSDQSAPSSPSPAVEAPSSSAAASDHINNHATGAAAMQETARPSTDSAQRSPTRLSVDSAYKTNNNNTAEVVDAHIAEGDGQISSDNNNNDEEKRNKEDEEEEEEDGSGEEEDAETTQKLVAALRRSLEIRRSFDINRVKEQQQRRRDDEWMQSSDVDITPNSSGNKKLKKAEEDGVKDNNNETAFGSCFYSSAQTPFAAAAAAAAARPPAIDEEEEEERQRGGSSSGRTSPSFSPLSSQSLPDKDVEVLLPHKGSVAVEDGVDILVENASAVEMSSSSSSAATAAACISSFTIDSQFTPADVQITISYGFVPSFSSHYVERCFTTWIGRRHTPIDLTFSVLLVLSIMLGVLSYDRGHYLMVHQGEVLGVAMCAGLAVIPATVLTLSSASYQALRERLLLSVRLYLVGIVATLAVKSCYLAAMYGSSIHWMSFIMMWTTECLAAASLGLRLRLKVHCAVQAIGTVLVVTTLPAVCASCTRPFPAATAVTSVSRCIVNNLGFTVVLGCVFPTLVLHAFEMRARRAFAHKLLQQQQQQQHQ